MRKTAGPTNSQKPRRSKRKIARDEIKREHWDLPWVVDRSVLERITQGHWPPADDLELPPVPDSPETTWGAPEWQALREQTDKLAEQWRGHSRVLARAGQRAASMRASALADVLEATARTAGPRSTRRTDMNLAQQRMNAACWAARTPASPETRDRFQAEVEAEDDWLVDTSASARGLNKRPANFYDDAAAIEWFEKGLFRGLANNPVTNGGGNVWADSQALARLCLHALDGAYALAKWIGPALSDPDGFWAEDRQRVARELAEVSPARREQFLAQYPEYRDLDAQQDTGPSPLTRLEQVIRLKIERTWAQADAVAGKSHTERKRIERARVAELMRETLVAFGASRDEVNRHLMRDY